MTCVWLLLHLCSLCNLKNNNGSNNYLSNCPGRLRPPPQPPLLPGSDHVACKGWQQGQTSAVTGGGGSAAAASAGGAASGGSGRGSTTAASAGGGGSAASGGGSDWSSAAALLLVVGYGGQCI